jgi:FKBP-type peptidyl-prolyl cis-trans isomerase 2
MAELLAKRPRHPQVRLNWQKMNDQERAEAVKQYEQDVKRWDENHDYRGRSVQWTLAVVAIHKNSQQTVVEMTSPAGYMITADLEDSAVAAAQALKPDQNVEVSGVIEDYRLENESGGLFDSGAMRFGVALKQATVKPARK